MCLLDHHCSYTTQKEGLTTFHMRQSRYAHMCIVRFSKGIDHKRLSYIWTCIVGN